MSRFTLREIAARKSSIQNLIIEIDQVRRVERELELRMLAGGGAGSAKLTMLIAPSGCGKSTTVREAKTRLKRKPELSGGSLMPIVYCSLPAQCSIKTLTTALLTALNDPLAARHGTAGTNSLRIIRLLQAQDVRLVILDEFQHLTTDRGSNAALITTDWLKEVLDGANVPVVCVGLETSLDVISGHQQIRRRTTKVIRLKPFAWDNGENSSRFRAFLYLFEQQLGLPQPSGLGERNFAERIYIASSGLIGDVIQLSAEALEVSMSRTSGPDSLTMADFAEAYDQLPFSGLNPFDPSRQHP